MSKFAANTTVPVERSRAEVEQILTRYGAGKFAYYGELGRSVIIFEAQDRRLRFDLPLPVGEGLKEAQQRRQKWRALLLAIKSKLESVESGIETFEEAFLAHVLLPDGSTVGHQASERIAHVYKTGQMQALLPAPPRQSKAS